MSFRNKLTCVYVIAATLFLAATPAWTAGPLDGSYRTSHRFPGGFEETVYVVVLQNNARIGLVLLSQIDSFWTWGEGFLEADGVVRGSLFTADGARYGHFSATIAADGRLTAVIDDGAVSHMEGTRFF